MLNNIIVNAFKTIGGPSLLSCAKAFKSINSISSCTVANENFNKAISSIIEFPAIISKHAGSGLKLIAIGGTIYLAYKGGCICARSSKKIKRKIMRRCEVNKLKKQAYSVKSKSNEVL